MNTLGIGHGGQQVPEVAISLRLCPWMLDLLKGMKKSPELQTPGGHKLLYSAFLTAQPSTVVQLRSLYICGLHAYLHELLGRNNPVN